MAQSLIDVMSQVRGGFALHKAGERLQEVLEAVRDTHQAGELTLTLKIKPDKNDERVVTIQPIIKTKVPEKGFTEGIFFVDDDGNVTREDPKQIKMQLDREKQGVTTMQQAEKNLEHVGRG